MTNWKKYAKKNLNLLHERKKSRSLPVNYEANFQKNKKAAKIFPKVAPKVALTLGRAGRGGAEY